MSVSGFASSALAQAPAANQNSNQLEEVVVTATRQTSTVNKVALSVSAVTQKSLDQQGIRSVQDLSNQVPGFTYRVSGNENNPNLTLRGIGGNAIAGTSGSAPTTGVYIDDQPLMKRNLNGLETGSGSPTPLLYDLDRIEVLRGPQGTLYGGSSEGGTIRFIMPTPSLTTYSGSARVGWSTMTGGGQGNEEGLALGGPLVQDKLGFRIAGYRVDDPGWTDRFSAYDGHEFAQNVNWDTNYSLRGALLWQVTPAFKATVSVFHQMNYFNDGPGVTTSSPSITVPTRTVNLASGTIFNPATNSFTNGVGVNGVSFSFPAAVIPGYTTPAQTWLGNGNGTTTGRYLTATDVQYIPSPRRTIFTTPSITLDYNWNDKLDFRSITAYMDDRTSGWTFTQSGVRPLPLGVPQQAITKQLQLYANQPCPSGPGLLTPILTSTCALTPAYQQVTTVPGGVGGTVIPGPADAFGYYFFNNRRGQTTQEFRVTTTDPSWRLQFVAGVFIEHEHNHANVGSSWNEPQLTFQVLGVPEQWLQGIGAAPVQQVPTNPAFDVSTRNIDVTENEQSVFADVTFAVIPDKFKIEAGVRAVNYTQDYFQQYGGTVASAPAGWYGSVNGINPVINAAGAVIVPTGFTLINPALGVTSGNVVPNAAGVVTNPNSNAPFPVNYAACPQHLKDAASTAAQTAFAKAGCPYQYTANSLKENPVTPKVGASYQLTANDMVYVTYAEGYRPGGINPFVPPIMCQADLAAQGLTQSPGQYQHDYVKSTEVGGKFRLFDGQMQLNAAGFHIEWDNVQFVESLPTCAFSYIANAATATSDGGELQATARFMGFTFNGNLAYDDAKYSKTALGPPRTDGKPRVILVNKGDNLGVPDWTANAGLQYDTRIATFPVYARIDFAYTGKYMRQTSAGTVAFNPTVTPNYINGNETHIWNARVGMYYKDLEIAGYVKNLFDSHEWINLLEGPNTYAFTGNTVVPRIIGVQLNYRF